MPSFWLCVIVAAALLIIIALLMAVVWSAPSGKRLPKRLSKNSIYFFWS